MHHRASVIDDEPLLTAEQVAQQFQIAIKTVQRLVLRGELRAVRVGKLYRFERAEIEAYRKRSGGR